MKKTCTFFPGLGLTDYKYAIVKLTCDHANVVGKKRILAKRRHQ